MQKKKGGKMIRPQKLSIGDTIATISPALGCAGDSKVIWKYQLGIERLKELGLNVVAAPNSLKGSSFLASSPEARAEDFMWAFENKTVKAIIANIGGNDSERLLPFISDDLIINNPKIFCGYSDIMTLHLYCYKLGLQTFYGDNLLTNIAETQTWHPYSKYWFEKCFFDTSVIGNITPSDFWSFSKTDYYDPKNNKQYVKNNGYMKIQGEGVVQGRLFGGHGGLFELNKTGIILNDTDFENKIFFFEDIPEICNVDYMKRTFDMLGERGWLNRLNGIIIGKMASAENFELYAQAIREVVSNKYGLYKLPIMYGLNFGHTSPIFILPYNALAELDVDSLRFSILESGVN